MRTTDVNKLQEAMRTGKPLLGMPLQTSSPEDLIEMLGYAGLEYIFIDREHQPIGWDTIANMIRACELSGIFTRIRVNKQYPGYPVEIRKAYELGAGLVTVPHVNTKEEALAIVRASKYGPDYEYGPWPADQIRGAGTMARGSMYRMAAPVDEIYKLENEKRMIGIALEEERAFEDIEEMIAVEGLDSIGIGPGDLAFSMGTPSARYRRDDYPEYKKLFEKMEMLKKKYPGKFVKTDKDSLNWLEVITDPEKAKAKIEHGIREGVHVFRIASDQGILREVVKRCKKVLEEAYEKVKEEGL